MCVSDSHLCIVVCLFKQKVELEFTFSLNQIVSQFFIKLHKVYEPTRVWYNKSLQQKESNIT